MLVHRRDSFWREHRRRIRRARKLEPALDVSLGLVRSQRNKMRSQRDSLFQLPQADGVEFFIQFRLSHQENLKQLLLRGLKIRQKPDFFENFR
jgi:hypothetical protein